MEKYYKNGMYKFKGGEYFVYEISNGGGKPQLEGVRKTEQECKDLIDTFI